MSVGRAEVEEVVALELNDRGNTERAAVTGVPDVEPVEFDERGEPFANLVALTDRLRCFDRQTCTEAAERIETLEAELAAMRAGGEPVAVPLTAVWETGSSTNAYFRPAPRLAQPF